MSETTRDKFDEMLPSGSAEGEADALLEALRAGALLSPCRAAVDPRDAAIAELRAEVERLAGLLDWHAPRAGDPLAHTASARALLARLEKRGGR